jgi:hypothetical protein
MPPRVWNVTPATTTTNTPQQQQQPQQQPQNQSNLSQPPAVSTTTTTTTTTTSSSRRVLNSIGDKLTAATSRPRSVFIRAFNGKDGSGAALPDDVGELGGANGSAAEFAAVSSSTSSAFDGGVGVTRDRGEEFFAVRRNDVKLVM